MTELEKLVNEKKGGSRNAASSNSYLSEMVEKKKAESKAWTPYADAAKGNSGAKNLYAAAARAMQNQSRTPPSLYAEAAAQLRQQSGNAARGSSSVLKTIFNKADDRTPTLYSGKYADYMKAGDYSELSKSAGSKRQFFGDAKYDYINNIANFRSQADLAQAQGRGSDYGKYAFMTSDEVGVYNYLYATQGRRAANRFLGDIEPELDKQWYSGANRGTVEVLGKNAGTRALASAMTVAAQPVRNLTSVIAMGEDAVRSAKGQEINPYSKWRQASNITQDLRADTSEHIEEKNPGIGGKVGSFVYNTAMSAADSAMNSLVAKGFGTAAGLTGDTLMKATNILGSALMSSEVASQAVAESKEKGYSNAGAVALGLTRGAIEYASEAVGGEWVIKNIKANPLSFVKSMAINMIPEGMEEVMSDAANGVVNLAVDAMFGTEESGIPKMLAYYRSSGTEWQKNHAELATVLAILGEEGLSFLGGALATVGTSAVQYGTNRANINFVAERLDTTPKAVVQLMEEANTNDPGAVYALAELTDAKNDEDLRKKIGSAEDMERATAYLARQMAQEKSSGEGEGKYIAETKNAAEGISTALRGAVNDSPSVSLAADTSPYTGEAESGNRNDMKGELTNGQSTYQGRENGAAGLGTGREAFRAEGGKGAFAGSQGEVRQSLGENAQADLRQVTAAQLGIRNGGNETVTVVDAQKLGGTAKRAADFAAANGREAVAVRGAIQVGAGYANAYVENGRVFFRVDATDAAGNPISPTRLVEHELFHEYVSEEVLETAEAIIRENLSEEEFDAMKASYRAAYANIYDLESLSEAEIEQLLREEIAADAFAGLNWFSDDGAVREAIRTETERNAPAQRTEARKETTGPPEGRAAIVTLPDGKKYVQADRQVIFGNDPASWADQIEGYINRKIRGGEDVVLTTDSGDVLTITKDTAGKASFRNYVRDANGRLRPLTDSEYETKLNAEAHIDELAKVSEKTSSKAKPDEIGRTGTPIHGDLAKNGWYYRRAWFQDFDGKYYQVTISTADGANGVVVYNVGQIERRSLPSFNGSSDSVTETGARWGNASSENNIRSSSANSQGKSSGRASVAGISARTADGAALRRAEAMEKSGTDNETIRQETGWYRGRDGKWRFEIDDSGMEFRRDGDAQLMKEESYRRLSDLTDRWAKSFENGAELSEAETQEMERLQEEYKDAVWEEKFLLRDFVKHDALFDAYPALNRVSLAFDTLPDGTKGYFSKRDNTIVLSDSLFGKEADTVLHEIQHVIQKTEGFTGGASPAYWNRGENYDKAVEKYRDNRLRTLNGLSAEEREMYEEYRSIDREMSAAFNGEALYDESRMDALEKRSDELYKELYGKEWFGKLNRYDRILGDAEAATKDFYYNTAGEIEARDTANRRKLTAEERRKTPPDLGDADTVFADGNNISAYVDVDADGNPVTVVQTDKDVFDNAHKSAYANIAKKLIMSKYAGQTLPLGENDLARITSKSGGEYGYPSTTIDIGTKEYDAKMRAAAELHNLLENSTYDHWAPDMKNHKEATLGFDYYRTVFAVNGKIFEGLVNVANSENGRVFYDITKIREVPDINGKYAALLARSSSVFENLSKEASDYTRKHVAPLARSSSTFGNLSEDNIRSKEGNSQGKFSGRASAEVEKRNADGKTAKRQAKADERVLYNTSMSTQEIFRRLLSDGFARVTTQASTPGTPKIAEYTVTLDTNGVEHWGIVKSGGREIRRFTEYDRNTAAQKAAEFADEVANARFTEALEQRRASYEAEKADEENARMAEEILGALPEETAEWLTDRRREKAEKGYAVEEKEIIRDEDAAASKVTDEVTKERKSFTEWAEEFRSGAMRMFVNDGDTITQIAKKTGNKGLEGYYFNAGAYSQRAGNWITKGGARTDLSGHKTGESLMDMLAPMRKDADVYRDFQLYLLHMHNVDRMKYDNTAEVEQLRYAIETLSRMYPKLTGMENDYLFQTAAVGDPKAQLSAEEKAGILEELKTGGKPVIADITEAAQMLIYARDQQSIAKGKGLKPVFGYDVTAYDSQTAAKELLGKHPEFKDWAEKVYAYSNDLINYRVESGLISQRTADNLRKRYPHYVPTLRVEGTGSRAAKKAKRNGGIVVSSAVGKAVGSDAVLLPLHTSLSRKTVATMKNAGMNMLGRELLSEYDVGSNDLRKYIKNVQESEFTPSDQSMDGDELYLPVRGDRFSVIADGKRYEIEMDTGLSQAMNAFSPNKYANTPVARGLKKINDLFKALCTGYSPFFMARNAVRDWQDAGFYSTDWATWEKMYPSAVNQIRKNGEIWQQYKALGGSYASMLDYATGMVKEPKNAAGKVWAKFEALGQAIEAAPRLAEFMTILANKGGSKTVNGVKTGKFTQSDLMEAMLGAADITTNFARGGTVTKALNRYLVPFLNPSVQGFDKFLRTATGTRTAKAAGKLILKAALMGVLPSILNALMWDDDDEWKDIPPESKANYYLMKLGNGYWLKIPKGRAIAVLSTAAVYGAEALKGNKVTFSDVFDVVKSNIAPTDVFNQNIATTWTQAKLFNPDNPGTTWYGGNIESERLQNYRPGERYDEKTDAISKWLGGKLNLSPKKINYILDQYSGVIGDLLLPMITPATNASNPLLAAPKAAFTLDTTSVNRVTNEYYDLLDDLKYDRNDGDLGAEITRKYVSHAGDEVSDYYAQIREIQNDGELPKGEKNRLVRALKKQLIERQRDIIAQSEPYREAVNTYLKEHPELSSDNGAAVAEYAEANDITEEQAENRMDAIVYRECNRKIFGAEYALKTYSSDVYDKARAAYAKGVSYDTYYDYYFATKDMHADKDENGKSISGTKKAKVVEYINGLDIPAEQKDALYIAAGYKENSLRYQPWNGGSGSGRGGRRRGKAKALKAPAAPKAAKNVIPEAKASTGGTKGNAIADFAKMSGGTDIRKATEKAVDTVIKHGNRTITIKGGSPLDYFLKYGKLPSSR